MNRASMIHTQDGTVVICDPQVGRVSKRTLAEAEAEVRRLREAKERANREEAA